MGKAMTVIKREIREAIPPTILFAFLFHMIAITRAVAQGDYEIDTLRATSATIAALIVAKSILIVEALPFAKLRTKVLAWQILWKTVLFTVLALLIRLLEQFIDLAREHGGMSAAVAAFRDGVSWPNFTVNMVWVFGGLLLYCTAMQLIEIVGKERFKAMMWGRERVAG